MHQLARDITSACKRHAPACNRHYISLQETCTSLQETLHQLARDITLDYIKCPFFRDVKNSLHNV
ncbi:unnamed protein product [Brugia pahangi]|uniref:Uncharacterized protein n=1 Tax=Brugia pahangi TaxID=6280 RepID=A0A0N4SYM7_BRUPA|nr:unnamed protein product [Brugia pahangi]